MYDPKRPASKQKPRLVLRAGFSQNSGTGDGFSCVDAGQDSCELREWTDAKRASLHMAPWETYPLKPQSEHLSKMQFTKASRFMQYRAKDFVLERKYDSSSETYISQVTIEMTECHHMSDVVNSDVLGGSLEFSQRSDKSDFKNLFSVYSVTRMGVALQNLKKFDSKASHTPIFFCLIPFSIPKSVDPV